MLSPFSFAVNADRETQLAHSLGAVLIGSLVGLFLSGAVAMQVFLYYQLYPKDMLRIKVMVFSIWVIDALHSVMTMTANWQYLIQRFGDWDTTDEITWSIAVSVVLTAIITFFVHCFFIHRIYNLSHKNMYITVPLTALALVRLITASISTSEMIRLRSFSGFVHGYDFVFTIGLSTAASLDIFITIGLCYFLRRGRSALGSMDRIIDTITLYTVENGMLTCVTTIASLVCWVTMPTNLIFLGLHFAISKLYANSFLATLNARKSLLNKSQGSADHPLPVLFPTNHPQRRMLSGPWSQRSHTETRLEVTIKKTIHRDIDEAGGSPPGVTSEVRSRRESSAIEDMDTVSKPPPSAYLGGEA